MKVALIAALIAPFLAQAQEGGVRDRFKRAPEGVIYQEGYVEPLIEEERPVSRSVPKTGAVIRALDKISGRVNDLEAPVGQEVVYERLTIRVEQCRTPPEGEAPDAFVYLTIRDARRDEEVFAGWMFASSPALSAMDHQRYDIWALSCAG